MAEKKIEKSRQEKAIEKMQKEDEAKKEAKAEAKEEKQAKPKEEKPQSVEKKNVEKKPEKTKTKKVTKKKLPEEIHTINLRQAYDRPTSRRAKAAIDVIRNYVYKHKRKQAEISPELNAVIWERGIAKPPRKIKVRLVIGPDTVTVYPVK